MPRTGGDKRLQSLKNSLKKVASMPIIARHHTQQESHEASAHLLEAPGLATFEAIGASPRVEHRRPKMGASLSAPDGGHQEQSSGLGHSLGGFLHVALHKSGSSKNLKDKLEGENGSKAEVEKHTKKHPPSKPFNFHSTPEFLSKLAKGLSKATMKEHHVEGIAQAIYLNYLFLGNETLGIKHFKYLISLTPGVQSSTILSKEHFISAMQNFLSPRSDEQLLELYIKMFAEGKKEISRSQLSSLLVTTYSIALHGHLLGSKHLDDVLKAIVEGAMHGKEEVSVSYIHSWFLKNCSRILLPIHNYVTHKVTVGHTAFAPILHRSVSVEAYDQPIEFKEKEYGAYHALLEEDCTKDAEPHSPTTPMMIWNRIDGSEILNAPVVWAASTALPASYIKSKCNNKGLPGALCSNVILKDPHSFIMSLISTMSTPTHWSLLYDSSAHGMGLNRFQYHLFNYRGPTVVFLRGEGNHLFCLAADVEWRDSNLYWGNKDCILIQILPQFYVLERGEKLFYYNASARGYRMGLQVGADTRNPSLSINPNFTMINFKQIPLTLLEIVAYGCADAETKDAQVKQKKWEVQQAEKSRNMKLKIDWKENPDRYLLELAGRPVYNEFYEKT
ncbi:unnamed protein product [Darwinula stevensoni]|uniref:TLDc domain-containing protein n=1 Tax=Darwinula stevensoni TaxID=69355 RepID=A0A7R8X4I4_9CRUS|nr:unnamed protein product [Darwinula stevensoni]CAG0879704.1 unnamed protein product [Darwinula stevensoni]